MAMKKIIFILQLQIFLGEKKKNSLEEKSECIFLLFMSFQKLGYCWISFSIASSKCLNLSGSMLIHFVKQSPAVISNTPTSQAPNT